MSNILKSTNFKYQKFNHTKIDKIELIECLADGPCSVVVPVEGSTDKLVVSHGTDIVLLTWDGESDVINPPIKKLASIDTDRSDTQTDDGKCDSSGRLWIGWTQFLIK